MNMGRCLMASIYRTQLEDYLKTLDIKADRVLDVGGLDKPIQPRVKSFEANRVAILDHEGGDYQLDLNEFKAPQEVFAFETSLYWDTIFCLEVFEYIWNPVVAFKNLYNWLAENGTMYVTFPTNYPLHNPKGIDYMRYTGNWVEKMARLFPFQEVEIVPRPATYKDYLQAFWSAERMHPIKDDERLFDNGYICKFRK